MAVAAGISHISSKNAQGAVTFRMKRFIAVFLECGGNVEEACRRIHIRKQTYYVWMENSPAFVQELSRKREAVLKTAFSHLTNFLDEAIEVYSKLLKSESEAIRKGVCEGLIDRILKLREQESLVERIDRLEKILEV